ncbi:NFX1-type zinc finger-containing protein 1-like [Littorina saxatilis]|uniref:NFX1-type zinc finger-containing protein 1-like n=1 Tax=Littorina saxatilis TaxID=31220 RepID=UPI0038B4AA55
MAEYDQYFNFDDTGGAGGRDREYGGHAPRGGRGGRGRPRGPRSGRGGRDDRDSESNLRRFSSNDSLNRRGGGRGEGNRDRGHSGRDRREDYHESGRGRGRDHSYDSRKGRDHSEGTGRGRGGYGCGYRGDRGGGRGGGGGGGRAEDGQGYRGDRGGGRGGGGRDGERRGRGGYQGPNRERRQKQFPLRHVVEIEDVEDATLRVNSQLEEFEQFLSDTFMSPDDSISVLKILGRVVQNDLHRESVLLVLQAVCTSHFLDTHLLNLIQKLPSFLEFGSERKVIETLQLLLQLLSNICLKLPSYASRGYLLLTVLNTLVDIQELLRRQEPGLAEDLENMSRECQDCMKSSFDTGQRRVDGTRRRRGPNEDDETPPDDFALLPIFPSAKDMDWSENIFLRANKEEGSFRDVNHYLDVQFRLMREDYIRPLRKGIKDYKQMIERGETGKKISDLRLYHKTRVLSMVCKDSLEHRIQFDFTKDLKRVRWQSSKRLLFGSLVCLSMDDFDTIFFAVVTNREIKDLEKGIIQIRFEEGLEEILGTCASDTFTMAETTAYFEAYRHVLEGLQEMKDCLPMSRYLVECNSSIKPPNYLVKDGVRHMDLSAMLREDSHENASSVAVLNPSRWPPLEQTTLNESQMEAMKIALTKELAIIQGPPGTGKTYVGLKVAKILLENRDVWTDPDTGEKPILVVCYTNHALDQFLEGILEFCPEGIVRVGSRCKNPQLEDFNLKNLRRTKRTERKVNMSVRNSIRDSLRKLKELKDIIDGVSAKLEATATNKGIIGVTPLQHHMLPGQYDSLIKKDLYSSPTPTTMVEWLSAGMITQGGPGPDDDEDPYAMLAAEVTSQILQGKEVCQENIINLNLVHTLTHACRAQLYRFWHQKLNAALQQDIKAGRNVVESARCQLMAKQGILPDAVLQRVVSGHIFSAITYPMKQHQEQQTQFCVRAWLGISEGSSPQETSGIIDGSETCDERSFPPTQMKTLPRKTRIQLYRSWLQKATYVMKREQKQNPQAIQNVLASAQREILPDVILKDVINPALFRAIKSDMLQRLEKQSQYFVRAWLGIQEFCQNPRDLERLLDQLEDESEELKEEEGQLNAEEDAEIIQNERKLDLDDDDDLFDFGKKKSNVDVSTAMKELGVQSASSAGGAEVGDDGFSFPQYHRKKQAKKMKTLLASSQPMTEEEAERVRSLWSQGLSVEHRVRLYLFWLRRYQGNLRLSVQKHAEDYNTISRQLRELRLGEDKDILVEATVIGMTTTGAARYRRVLNSVACPIIILEEAAEVLESHVVTTLHQKCQHLILIGDHQQLRPSPTVYELCRHYNLDLSLFERLVKNRLLHATLAVQHRMRPDIARLVRHVYPELKDHDTTRGRRHIRGLKQDVFLFYHEVEETRNDETSSKSNQHEAELCVRLCRYLLQQGYSPETITILTAYSGQVFTLKNIMKTDLNFYRGVRVTAVDNYQGEENDIIILSLVRSNQEGSVGFLGTDNRVCVALSRARNGFFAFGNFRILADNSELWKNICRTAKENVQLGDTLVLRCENHREQEVEVITAKDFDKMPEGGCKLPCGTRLAGCGHVCELSCHGYDRTHEKYKCRKKCERVTCKLGHPCTKRCSDDCGQCLYMVEKVIPMCSHKAKMECRRDPYTWECKDKCPGILPCGHKCCGKCADCRKKKSHVTKCTEEVERVWPCGHLVKSACNIPVGELPCDRACEATLDCGHVCSGTCGKCLGGRVHVSCKSKCSRVLPGCGHKCQLPCGTKCLPCKAKQCGTACRHSSCKQSCAVPCPPCMERCPWKTCKHQDCDSLCNQPCKPCPQPCEKKHNDRSGSSADPNHPEQHPCSGVCGEKCVCFICDKKDFVPVMIGNVLTEEESQIINEHTILVKLNCGHVFNVKVLDVYVNTKCPNLPPGKALTCPLATCNKMISETHCWRYARLLRERHDRLQEVKQTMIDDTSIKQPRIQKLHDSLKRLTHDAEKEKSFASKAALGHVFKQDTIDVNRAFALTNQIKLARVVEMILDLSTTCGVDKEIKDLQVFQAVLYKPMSTMSPQRLRELRGNTRRLVYKTQLALAKISSNTMEFKRRTESCLVALDQQPGLEASVLEDVEQVLRDCKENCRITWRLRANSIDTSILDAPDEQDLCDVGKPFQPPPSAGARPSALPREVKPKVPPRPATKPTVTGRTGDDTAIKSSSLLLEGASSSYKSPGVGLSALPREVKPMVPPRPAPRPTVTARIGDSAIESSSLLLDGASSYTSPGVSRFLPVAPTRQPGAEVKSSVNVGGEGADDEVGRSARLNPSAEALENMSLDDIMSWVRTQSRSSDADL